MKISTSPECEFCGETDNTTHFFLSCPNVESFWRSFFKWWNRTGDIIITNEYEDIEESILFGVQIEGEVFQVLNWCILQAKYYIHKQRLFNNNNIDFYEFLLILKYKLQIEQSICINNGTETKFNKFIHIYSRL